MWHRHRNFLKKHKFDSWTWRNSSKYEIFILTYVYHFPFWNYWLSNFLFIVDIFFVCDFGRSRRHGIFLETSNNVCYMISLLLAQWDKKSYGTNSIVCTVGLNMHCTVGWWSHSATVWDTVWPLMYNFFLYGVLKFSARSCFTCNCGMMVELRESARSSLDVCRTEG